MFVREVVVGKKSASPARYVQIVESFRDEDTGTPRHRVLFSLGRVDKIDREQLRRFVASLSKYLDEGTLPADARVLAARDFGIPFFADAVWTRAGISDAITRALRKRRFDSDVERALFTLVAHRLSDPGSKLGCERWCSEHALLPGTESFKVHALYRAMDLLDESHEEIEAAVFAKRRTLFDRISVVYFDTTSTYFDNEDDGRESDEYGLRQYGHSRDLRPDRRQIIVGLATDQDGIPIASQVHSGDSNDALTVEPMVSRLKELGLSKRVVWIADRGMASEGNLSTVRAAGLHYVVGVRLRRADTLRERIQQDHGAWTTLPEPASMRVKDVTLHGRRYVVCFSPESAERDLKLRVAAIDRLHGVLKLVHGSPDNDALITENGWYSRLCSRGPDGRWMLDKDKLDREAACDGTFVLDVSDPTMPAADAAVAYKGLLRVERCFHALKNTLDLRPVYHRIDRRIRAHVTVCMLALLVERVMERDTRQSFHKIAEALRTLHAVQLVMSGRTVWETTALTKDARDVLESARVALPPRLLPDRT